MVSCFIWEMGREIGLLDERHYAFSRDGVDDGGGLRRRRGDMRGELGGGDRRQVSTYQTGSMHESGPFSYITIFSYWLASLD